jgi:hypothetical protein
VALADLNQGLSKHVLSLRSICVSQLPLLLKIATESKTSPTSFANGATFAEQQGDWVVEAVNYCIQNKKKTIEPTHEVNHVSHMYA